MIELAEDGWTKLAGKKKKKKKSLRHLELVCHLLHNSLNLLGQDLMRATSGIEHQITTIN